MRTIITSELTQEDAIADLLLEMRPRIDKAHALTEYERKRIREFLAFPPDLDLGEF